MAARSRPDALLRQLRGADPGDVRRQRRHLPDLAERAQSANQVLPEMRAGLPV